MSDYSPIPIPLRQRWRYFRTRYVPYVVFALAVVTVVSIWQGQSTPAVVVGEVYAPTGPILSPVDGIIENFQIAPYQQVKAGQVLGQVRMVPETQALAAIAALRAEIEMIRIGAGDPVLDQQRNLLSWQSLRRDWLLARSDHAALLVTMRQAESDYRRLEGLVAQGAESQAVFEQGKSLYEALAAEEVEMRKLVEQMEKAVAESRAFNGEDQPSLAQSLNAALDWKEKELKSLEALNAPHALVAPYDGSFTMIYRRQGEFAKKGEPIADFRASKADYIVGYIKQPFNGELNIGMEVEIAKRASRSAVAVSTIISIGPQFEPLGLAFVRPLPVLIEERALPILITLPKELDLRPGELVDLRLRPDHAHKSNFFFSHEAN